MTKITTSVINQTPVSTNGDPCRLMAIDSLLVTDGQQPKPVVKTSVVDIKASLINRLLASVGFHQNCILNINRYPATQDRNQLHERELNNLIILNLETK